MIKVVTVSQMQAIERASDESKYVSYSEMMENAGRAIANHVQSLLQEDGRSARIVILVGNGNNGGDGLVAARILKLTTMAQVGCYMLSPRPSSDGNYMAAKDAGVFLVDAENDQRYRTLTTLIANADIIIDAIVGTGARLPLREDMQRLLQHVASSRPTKAIAMRLAQPLRPDSVLKYTSPKARIIAVDCPSGLDCDTGHHDPTTLKADVTITFAAAKHGHIKFPGANLVGELLITDIGVPVQLAELDRVDVELATADDIKLLIPPRPHDSHKGTYGTVNMLAGSSDYPGAALLCAKAAYRAGAGLVRLAASDSLRMALAGSIPEAVWVELANSPDSDAERLAGSDSRRNSYVIGPGLGRYESAATLTTELLARIAKQATGSEAKPLPGVVIDADGLNHLAEVPNWWELLPPNCVITPHPGEMSRLTGQSTEEITNRRIETAKQHSELWGCVVMLKGAFTVVAAPGKNTVIMPFSSDALATAGTGDVLAGCIGGLMAQGATAWESALAGSYVHGLAGQICGDTMTSRSVVASDVVERLPAAFSLLS